MGIGVHLDFVIEREGNPVLYVQNGDKGVIVENFHFLHKFVKKHSDPSKDKMLDTLEIILGYLKSMSEPNETDLEYYDEMEWRIVHLERLMEKYFSKKDEGKDVYRIDLKPDDVKIIVFPDDITKEFALKDPYISKFFESHLPILTTLSDCENF